MSTAYNRKRTEPRTCRFVDECAPSCDSQSGVHDGRHDCIRRVFTASPYCDDHRLANPTPEGPMGRKLRLQHQANQVAEAGKFAGKTHVKMPAWFKVRARKLRAKIATQAKKSLGSLLNPWAK